jgi:3-methyladenine DNA glycosylase AlkC
VLQQKKPMKKLLEKIKSIEHGFTHIVAAGDTILADEAVDPLSFANACLKDDSYQVRMLATYLLGHLSVDHPKALKTLETKVAADENWRVQEMLAKAFDYYCQSNDYEQSLPTIKKWLSDRNPNIRRAVVEGLRIWTGRPFFKDNPAIAIQLIASLRLKAGESEYLLRSVANALRDIRKKHASLVDQEISGWDLTNKTASSIKKIIEK